MTKKKYKTIELFAESPNIQECKAKTKSGSRCSRAAKTSGYCTQHYKMYKEGKLK